MNIEVNLNNLTKEEQEQFNALVEKANKPKSRVWKPEVGESYFAIESSERTNDRIVNYCVDSEYDKFNIAIGNCFKTREKAEFAIEKLKVIIEMKRYIAEHDDVGINWRACLKVKYGLSYNYEDDELFTNVGYSVSCGGLYAGDPIVIENMIKEIGEDRIKKYYFGVE